MTKSLNKLKQFLNEHPEINIVIGASTYRRYLEEEELPFSVRYHKREKFYYDSFNTAFLIDSSSTIQIHHKSKLTPGVEHMPSWGILKPIEKFAIDLGGSVGTKGRDKVQKPFEINDSIKIATIICYESVFGEYCTKLVDKGAQAFFVITNDGWWGDTP